jgi:hypothetical protein
MMSFIMVASPFSSDRRMGRPTIDGYWNSGKFCRAEVVSEGVLRVKIVS